MKLTVPIGTMPACRWIVCPSESDASPWRPPFRHTLVSSQYSGITQPVALLAMRPLQTTKLWTAGLLSPSCECPQECRVNLKGFALYCSSVVYNMIELRTTKIRPSTLFWQMDCHPGESILCTACGCNVVCRQAHIHISFSKSLIEYTSLHLWRSGRGQEAAERTRMKQPLE